MKSVVHIGSVLTGSSLINNYEFRSRLLRDFADNKSIGGEMEAQGIYSISRLHGISEWIIVKAICDWGYNKNNPVSTNDFSTARTAIEKAEPLSRDDYDTIHCESVKGKIAIGEGRHDDAIHLLKKMADTLNFKLVTKDYKDTEERCMLEQNLAVTYYDIAIAYRNKGTLQNAMIYVKRTVDAAESESLEHERAIFLDYWADVLIEDGLFDSAIVKATAAQEIFKKRNEKSRFVHVCDLLGAAYFRQGNLTSSCKS